MAGMSPRIIQTPLSGGDRKHHSREMVRVARLQADLVRRVDEAYRVADDHMRAAHRLLCEEWNARQFIGGPAEPSPVIADAIAAGCDVLEVNCYTCRHTSYVHLPDLVWPRDKPVHTLARVLFCRPCLEASGRKRRPNLVALNDRSPYPAAPAAQAQPRTG